MKTWNFKTSTMEYWQKSAWSQCHFCFNIININDFKCKRHNRKCNDEMHNWVVELWFIKLIQFGSSPYCEITCNHLYQVNIHVRKVNCYFFKSASMWFVYTSLCVCIRLPEICNYLVKIRWFFLSLYILYFHVY